MMHTLDFMMSKLLCIPASSLAMWEKLYFAFSPQWQDIQSVPLALVDQCLRVWVAFPPSEPPAGGHP